MDGRERSVPLVAAPAVIQLPDEIDAVNAGEVAERLAAVLVPGSRVVVADLTATVYCDSLGARTLVLAHKHAAARKIDLRFAIPSQAVLRVLQLTCLDQVLRIYPTVAAALPAGEG